jgi:pimeloyl-ACP methyl ester carboxylesterase
MKAQPTVVLVHGLWMGAWQMTLLAQRLRRRGFIVKPFSYNSVMDRFAVNLKKLHRFVLAQDAAELHLVGHSLGGLLAARLVAEHHTSLPAGRVVCLGTPLRGSAIARRTERLRIGTLTLGFAKEALIGDGISVWEAPREIASIAGRTPIGFSMVLGGLARPHDGSVAVSETLIDGLTAHTVIAASHSGLVVNAQAARLTANFLRNGRLKGAQHADAAAG